MKILKRIGIGLAAIIILFLIVGLFLPSKYSAQRSIDIDAPVEKVFHFMKTVKNVEKWSPFKMMDSTVKIQIGPQASGVGAYYSYTSEHSGAGTITTKTLVPNESITEELNFHNRGISEANWTFKKTETGANLTWEFHGDAGMNIPFRYIALRMDKMMGPVFAQGLGAGYIEGAKNGFIYYLNI